MESLRGTVERLCEASLNHAIDPWKDLQWPATLPETASCFTTEFISLYGTSYWSDLSEDQRRRLAYFEAVNFFSLNIHGEKGLMEGLAHRLYQRGKGVIAPYLHHFLDEENRHSVYFGRFCTQYAGKIYRDRQMGVPREYAEGEEDLLFFAKVMIFEEIVDVYNLRMADDERLVEIVRQINRFHHLDEARHLVFGREIVKMLWQNHSVLWTSEVRQNVQRTLETFLTATWKQYYNPDVYADAGLADPYQVHMNAWEAPAAKEYRRKVSEKCVRYMLDVGLFEKEPSE